MEDHLKTATFIKITGLTIPGRTVLEEEEEEELQTHWSCDLILRLLLRSSFIFLDDTADVQKRNCLCNLFQLSSRHPLRVQ